MIKFQDEISKLESLPPSISRGIINNNYLLFIFLDLERIVSCASNISIYNFDACVPRRTKYRKCRNSHVHATNCTLSKNCATSCAKKFNSAMNEASFEARNEILLPSAV